MEGILYTREHLDSNFTLEETKNSLNDLKLDVISQKNIGSIGVKKILNFISLNSIFLYYILYISIGIMTLSNI